MKWCWDTITRNTISFIEFCVSVCVRARACVRVCVCVYSAISTMFSLGNYCNYFNPSEHFNNDCVRSIEEIWSIGLWESYGYYFSTYKSSKQSSCWTTENRPRISCSTSDWRCITWNNCTCVFPDSAWHLLKSSKDICYNIWVTVNNNACIQVQSSNV